MLLHYSPKGINTIASSTVSHSWASVDFVVGWSFFRNDDWVAAAAFKLSSSTEPLLPMLPNMLHAAQSLPMLPNMLHAAPSPQQRKASSSTVSLSQYPMFVFFLPANDCMFITWQKLVEQKLLHSHKVCQKRMKP